MKIKLRDYFDVSDEGKDLHSLKSTKINEMIPINNMQYEILQRKIIIDELNRTIKCFSNDDYNI